MLSSQLESGTICPAQVAIGKMGFNLSKQGPGSADNIGILRVERQLLHYFSRSFFLRNLVSKKRRRMLVGGYDLDMSYITDRVLAMSFPAERMRAMYRNPMWQVKSVLDMRHPGHYKVFNLCIEQAYDPSHFHGRVERFPFDDNHVPPLYMIKEFCESVDSWLSLHSKNIAVVHCMAGKGRTGLMVSAYLVYTGMHAEDALQMYANKRTTNNEGVSIPSQRRYVSYWEKLLSYRRGGVDSGLPFIDLAKPCSRELRRVRLYDAANTESVFFVVSQLEEVPAQRYRPQVEVSRNCCRRIKKGGETTEYDRCYYSISDSDEEGKKPESKEPHLVAQMDTESPVIYQKTCLDYNYEKPIQVTGDVRLAFYQKMIGGRLFYACFNTSFINNSLLQFTVKDVDKIGKKGRSICGSAFCVELLFGPPNAVGVLSSSSGVSSSSDDLTP